MATGLRISIIQQQRELGGSGGLAGVCAFSVSVRIRSRNQSFGLPVGRSKPKPHPLVDLLPAEQIEMIHGQPNPSPILSDE